MVLANDEIPYIRYYRNGEFIKDSNFVEINVFTKILRGKEARKFSFFEKLPSFRKILILTQVLNKYMAVDNLPQVYDAAQIEKKMYEWWLSQGYFKPEKYWEFHDPTPEAPRFCLTIPPPNVTRGFTYRSRYYTFLRRFNDPL